MFLQWFPITCALRTVQGTGTRNAAQLWPGASNIAICRDRFEHTGKNQTAVFQSSTRLDLKHLEVTPQASQTHDSRNRSYIYDLSTRIK